MTYAFITALHVHTQIEIEYLQNNVATKQRSPLLRQSRESMRKEIHFRSQSSYSLHKQGVILSPESLELIRVKWQLSVTD